MESVCFALQVCGYCWKMELSMLLLRMTIGGLFLGLANFAKLTAEKVKPF